MNLHNINNSEKRAQIAKDTAAYLASGKIIRRFNNTNQQIGFISEKTEEIINLKPSETVTLYKGFKIIQSGRYEFDVWVPSCEACAPTRTLKAALRLVDDVNANYMPTH